MIVAFTGHRPERINANINTITNGIHGLIGFSDPPVTRVISGMAQGVDQLGAAYARMFKVPWTAAVPFKDQAAGWTSQARDMYDKLLESAEKIVFCSEEYHRGVYHVRDRWMVDNCELLAAVWDGIEKGGTWATIKYARKVGRPIKYLNWTNGLWQNEDPYAKVP